MRTIMQRCEDCGSWLDISHDEQGQSVICTCEHVNTIAAKNQKNDIAADMFAPSNAAETADDTIGIGDRISYNGDDTYIVVRIFNNGMILFSNGKNSEIDYMFNLKIVECKL